MVASSREIGGRVQILRRVSKRGNASLGIAVGPTVTRKTLRCLLADGTQLCLGAILIFIAFDPDGTYHASRWSSSCMRGRVLS